MALKLPDPFIPRVSPFMMTLLVVDSFASRSPISSFLNFQTIVYSCLAESTKKKPRTNAQPKPHDPDKSTKSNAVPYKEKQIKTSMKKNPVEVYFVEDKVESSGFRVARHLSLKNTAYLRELIDKVEPILEQWASIGFERRMTFRPMRERTYLIGGWLLRAVQIPLPPSRAETA